MSEPRGIRNHNPLNLRGSHTPWVGQVGVDAAGFCIFDNSQHGIRAAAITLVGYHVNHGINTLDGIVTRWAPPAENDTTAYVANVEQRTGLDAYTPLTFNPAEVRDILAAMIWHENGKQPYALNTIYDAAKDAISHWSKHG